MNREQLIFLGACQLIGNVRGPNVLDNAIALANSMYGRIVEGHGAPLNPKDFTAKDATQ